MLLPRIAGLPKPFHGADVHRSSLVHILGLGVFLTGFIKDFLSLPRPLSPPLHRITMSGSAALEYGFPSTHSANAVSVAVYGILVLHRPDNTLAPSTKLFLELLCYFYAVSIVFGRLYCGMHGFLDVIVGSAMGAAISIVEFFYGPPLDAYMHASSWMAPVIAGILIIALVRIHPEPADDCPCFDDSVAFASVFIGLEFATWTYGKIEGDPWETSAHANATIDVIPLGWMANTARIVFGVLIIFLWRGIMKPTMLRLLPHLFRLIERVGLSLPRRFFTPASEYKSVPPGSRIDTMLPSASDFPRMVESIRRPTLRGRSISVGPQSAADAYEALAYREFRRRQSNGKSQSFRGKADLEDRKRRKEDCLGEVPEASIPQTGLEAGDEGAAMLSDGLCPGPTSQKGSRATGEEQYEDRDVFSQLVKPRVRYDVEVVTKLVVYAGKPLWCPEASPWRWMLRRDGQELLSSPLAQFRSCLKWLALAPTICKPSDGLFRPASRRFHGLLHSVARAYVPFVPTAWMGSREGAHGVIFVMSESGHLLTETCVRWRCLPLERGRLCKTVR